MSDALLEPIFTIYLSTYFLILKVRKQHFFENYSKFVGKSLSCIKFSWFCLDFDYAFYIT